MSTRGHSTPLPAVEDDRERKDGGVDTACRLEDRVALFLKSLTAMDFTASRQMSAFSGEDVVEAGRLPKSTADRAQLHSQVLARDSRNKDESAARYPSTDSPAAQSLRFGNPNRGPRQSTVEKGERGKRLRSETAPYEDPHLTSLAPKTVAYTVGEPLPGAHVYPLPSHAATARLMPFNAATLHHRVPEIPATQHAVGFSVSPVGSGHAVVDIPLLTPIQTLDIEALTTSGVRPSPAVASLDPSASSSEQTSVASRMTALEKAKLDWETHISAMEQVLAANRAQGLPNHTISSDALQLLSQMISKLYGLNSTLLYAQTQHVLDEHRRNAKRIDAVFQGLSGVKPPPKAD